MSNMNKAYIWGLAEAYWPVLVNRDRTTMIYFSQESVINADEAEDGGIIIDHEEKPSGDSMVPFEDDDIGGYRMAYDFIADRLFVFDSETYKHIEDSAIEDD